MNEVKNIFDYGFSKHLLRTPEGGQVGVALGGFMNVLTISPETPMGIIQGQSIGDYPRWQFLRNVTWSARTTDLSLTGFPTFDLFMLYYRIVTDGGAVAFGVGVNNITANYSTRYMNDASVAEGGGSTAWLICETDAANQTSAGSIIIQGKHTNSQKSCAINAGLPGTGTTTKVGVSGYLTGNAADVSSVQLNNIGGVNNWSGRVELYGMNLR